jgi:hypothetical protein
MLQTDQTRNQEKKGYDRADNKQNILTRWNYRIKLGSQRAIWGLAIIIAMVMKLQIKNGTAALKISIIETSDGATLFIT